MSYGDPFSQMATANKLSINDIQRGIQAGTIDAYIGIPLIQQKVKDAQKMQLVQAVLRQAEGGPPQTVSDSVLQAAGQVTRPEAPLSSTLPATDRQRPAPFMEAMPQGGGIEMAQSNLPTEYAGGGIVAFADKGAVELPGEFEDKNKLKAAGYMDGRSALRRVFDPEENELRPWARKALDAYTGGIDYLADKFADRPTLPKEYQSSIVQPFAPSREQNISDLGVTPFSPPAAQADPLAFLRKPGEGASSPAQGSYLDRLTAMPGATGAGPAGGAAPAAQGREGITLTPGVQPPKAPEYGEPTSFAGLEQALQDYTQGSRSRRQRLEDIILGQQADRPAMERENLGAAVRQAGARIMAGRSPWALTNVGEGLMAGNEAYSAGVNQLRERDANIVKQLAALGLKGEELEQQAMRYGIDIQQLKTDTRYKEAVGRQIYAGLPALAMKPEEMQAGIEESRAKAGLYETQAAGQRVITELAPYKLALDAYKAKLKSAQERYGSIPADMILKLDTEVYNSVMADPLSVPEIADVLETNPDILKGLQQAPGSKERVRAERAIRPIVQNFIEKEKDKMRANSPSRRGTGYGYDSAED